MTIKNSLDYDWKNNHSTPKIVNKVVKILKKNHYKILLI